MFFLSSEHTHEGKSVSGILNLLFSSADDLHVVAPYASFLLPTTSSFQSDSGFLPGLQTAAPRWPSLGSDSALSICLSVWSSAVISCPLRAGEVWGAVGKAVFPSLENIELEALSTETRNLATRGRMDLSAVGGGPSSAGTPKQTAEGCPVDRIVVRCSL